MVGASVAHSQISREDIVAGIERGSELRDLMVSGNRSHKALGVTAVTLRELASNMNDPKLNTP